MLETPEFQTKLNSRLTSESLPLKFATASAKSSVVLCYNNLLTYLLHTVTVVVTACCHSPVLGWVGLDWVGSHKMDPWTTLVRPPRLALVLSKFRLVFCPLTSQRLLDQLYRLPVYSGRLTICDHVSFCLKFSSFVVYFFLLCALD